MEWLRSKWASLPRLGKKLVALLLALALLRGVSALVDLATESHAGPASTTTTTLSLTMARITLPMFGWFEMLADTPGNEIAAMCTRRYDGDIVKCYKAYERGTPDFEDRLARVLLRQFSQEPLDNTPRCGTSSYGECRDDYGSYCDESQVVVDDLAHDLRCYP